MEDKRSSSYENLIVQESSVSSVEACMAEVQLVFPDICPAELRRLADLYQNATDHVVNHLLDEQQKGFPYPRAPAKNLKRKREMDNDILEDGLDNDLAVERDRKTYHDQRKRSSKKSKINMIRDMIAIDFPLVPLKVVQSVLYQNNDLLYQGYLALFEATLTADDQKRGWSFLKKPSRNQFPKWLPGEIERSIPVCNSESERNYMQELQAARRAKTLRIKAKRLKEEESKNRQESEAAGLIFLCGCCFSEEPANRMITCLGQTQHWFCYDCVRRQAETQIGLSRFKLSCFAVGDCQAAFAPSDIRTVLNPKTIMALERLEQQDLLANAGLENVAACPFCPFAAESRPIEEDKEFRCLNPECLQVSCRLCEKPSHIPLSCQDAARESRLKDQGEAARRAIEEAMSDALIRSCNKCKTSFIKEYGCNRMLCTACGNLQCYICSESCEYHHFDDTKRGGQEGNCPLWDDVEFRHDTEVKMAEEAARNKVKEANPNLHADDLNFNMSERVAEDDARRAAKNPHHGRFPRLNMVPNQNAQQRPVPELPPRAPDEPLFGPGRMLDAPQVFGNPEPQNFGLGVPQVPAVAAPNMHVARHFAPLIAMDLPYKPVFQPMQIIKDRANAARRKFRRGADAPEGEAGPQAPHQLQQKQEQMQPHQQPHPNQQQQQQHQPQLQQPLQHQHQHQQLLQGDEQREMAHMAAAPAILPFGYIDPRNIGLQGH